MSEQVHQTIRFLRAPPAQVIAAWLEPPAVLAWFAEHCQIEARAGGAYRYWGRYTYGAPHAPASGALLTLVQGRAFEYTSRFAGRDGRVAVGVEAAERDGVHGTRLTLTHRYESPAGAPALADAVDDWWRMSIGNLEAYLGGREVMRVDFTDPAPRVHLSIYLDAPPERVYAALTEPALMQQWLKGAPIVDARPGGAYSYGWIYRVGGRDVACGPTRLIECVPNQRLVTDWPDWRGDPSRPDTRVTWRLATEGRGTRLTLTHEGYATPVEVGDYRYGWLAYLHALDRLLDAAG